jgi:hypothetical protein
MNNKWEQLIEHVISGEDEAASKLFHQITVEESRKIYESLVDEDETYNIGGNDVEDFEADISADEEGMDGGADDTEFDFDGNGELDDHEEGHGEIEDRVEDLETALDELKAEFDALVAEEEGEESEEEVDFGAEDDVDSEDDEEGDLVREYVEKVSAKLSGDAEVGTGKSVSVNGKSPVASKNDMGGTARNLNQGKRGTGQDGNKPTSANNYGTKGQGRLVGQVQNTAGGTKKLASANKPSGADNQAAGAGKALGAQNTKSPIAK